MNPYYVLIFGFLLIFLEFFLPGGVLGVAGGVLIVISIVLFAVQAESMLAVILYVVGAAVFLGLLVKFALWRIRRDKSGRGIYLHSDQEGYVASSYEANLIGKEGEALSDLKPSGHIIVEGKRLQAVSKVGYIEKGTHIMVIGGEGAHYIVKLKETS